MPGSSDSKKYLLNLPEIEAAGLLSFELIHPGTTNCNWKVHTQQGIWVVRKNAENVPGVDRHVEARVLKTIEPLQIAPKLIAVQPEQGYLITEFLEAHTWSAADCQRPELQARLFEALKSVHNIAINEPDTSVTARVEAYLKRAPENIRDRYRDLLNEALWQVEQQGFFEQQRLCHYDLNHNNIVGYDDIKILDWEFAGMAHPVLDVAVFGFYEQLQRINTAQNAALLSATQSLIRLLFEVWNHAIKNTDK